jgi:hypothetical protein
MNKIIILALIFLMSCSSEAIRVHPKKRGVDPVFVPYIKDYSNIINSKLDGSEYIYDQRIKKLSINFINFEGSTIGRCHWLLNGEFEIEIDRTYWERAPFLSRQFLVYHELEHCIRFRMHTHEEIYKKNIWEYIEHLAQRMGLIPEKGYFEDGCANSIMHPSDLGGWCHFAHYNDYVKDIINYKDNKL